MGSILQNYLEVADHSAGKKDKPVFTFDEAANQAQLEQWMEKRGMPRMILEDEEKEDDY